MGDSTRTDHDIAGTRRWRVTGSGYDRHGVKLRIEAAVSRFLCEVADSLERITNTDDFLAGLDGDDTVAETEEQKDARERKKDAVNKKRREKRNAAKQ